MATFINASISLQQDKNGKKRRHSHGSYAPLPEITHVLSPRLPPKLTDDIFKIPNPNPLSTEVWYEDRLGTLSNVDAHNISPAPVWLSDYVINTSLFILSRILNCPAHDIWLCDPYSAAAFYVYQQKIKEGEEPGDTTELVDKMIGKDFIFVPISDGYELQYEHGKRVERMMKSASTLANQSGLTIEEFIEQNPAENPHADKEETGSHWSLLIIDLRERLQLRATYFDSWCAAGYEACVPVASDIVDGMNTILDKDFRPQTRLPAVKIHAANVPDQKTNNAYIEDAKSACGPFVWAMAKEFAQYIIDARRANKASSIRIELPVDFEEMWDWNSLTTREVIRGLIDEEKRIRRHLNDGCDEWFD